MKATGWCEGCRKVKAIYVRFGQGAPTLLVGECSECRNARPSRERRVPGHRRRIVRSDDTPER